MIPMKQYLPIFAALFCFSCVSQQPREDVSLPQESLSTSDSTQLESPEKTGSESGPRIDSQNSLKASTAIKIPEDKIIIIKKHPPKSNKMVTDKKPVKPKSALSSTPSKTIKLKSTNIPSETSDESAPEQLSSNDKAGSAIPPAIVEQLRAKAAPEIQQTQPVPSISNKSEPEKSSKVDSMESASANEAEEIESKVALIIEAQNNSDKSNPETVNLETVTNEKSIEDTQITLNSPEFDLNILPMNFGDAWFLDRNNDKISNTTRCLLSSRKVKFNDGYSDSIISLELTTNTLLIKTNSSIDMSYPDIGIYIDQKEPFPLEELFGDSSILIKQNTKKITSQLLDGEMLTIKMGFWPTWPKTETRSIDFALSNFDNAYQSFLACEKL